MNPGSIILIFAFLVTPAFGQVIEKPRKSPESAQDLLNAEKRLQLTPKQKERITVIFKWALSGCDWLARDEKMSQSERKKKCAELFAQSLATALQELTPQQRELWRKSSAPDPKPPKKGLSKT